MKDMLKTIRAEVEKQKQNDFGIDHEVMAEILTAMHSTQIECLEFLDALITAMLWEDENTSQSFADESVHPEVKELVLGSKPTCTA